MGSYGHPFVIGPPRRLHPLKKIPFAIIMILCTAVPGVICQLMVIPDTDEWVLLMQQLQVCICAIEPVPHAVVLETQNFTQGLDMAPKLF